jgi:hypothetical protein
LTTWSIQQTLGAARTHHHYWGYLHFVLCRSQMGMI